MNNLFFWLFLSLGYEVKDPRISTLLSKAVIYILPRLLPSSIDDDDFMNCISVADDFNFGAELENNPVIDFDLENLNLLLYLYT